MWSTVADEIQMFFTGLISKPVQIRSVVDNVPVGYTFLWECFSVCIHDHCTNVPHSCVTTCLKWAPVPATQYNTWVHIGDQEQDEIMYQRGEKEGVGLIWEKFETDAVY
jgi:hypothetical protein